MSYDIRHIPESKGRVHYISSHFHQQLHIVQVETTTVPAALWFQR